jgi:magnesium-protoporphyrin IX monomethyl ester (oxidative) cyclase
LQDENRHGDFFAAIMKVRPEYLNDWKAKLWSRFFCHSVYITMYLNDHQRNAFYGSLGLNTTVFNQHVIIETNNSTARLFPAVRAVLLHGSLRCTCVHACRQMWFHFCLRMLC